MLTIEQQADEIYSAFSEQHKAKALASVKLGDVPKWESGDFAIDMIDELNEKYSATAIYEAVGKLYHVKGGTIKRRVHVSKNIPRTWINNNPHLSYSYWKTIADANHIEPKELAMSEVLLWISDHNKQYGLPSVALVESWVYGDGKVDYMWRLRSNDAVSLLDKIYYDDGTPTALKILVGWCRSMINQYLEHGISPLSLSVDKKRDGE
jgi:hypothetical protein